MMQSNQRKQKPRKCQLMILINRKYGIKRKRNKWRLTKNKQKTDAKTCQKEYYLRDKSRTNRHHVFLLEFLATLDRFPSLHLITIKRWHSRRTNYALFLRREYCYLKTIVQQLDFPFDVIFLTWLQIAFIKSKPRFHRV